MNRSILIILIPALIVAAGYVIVLRIMGLAPGYPRLIGAVVLFFGGIYWLSKRSGKKINSGRRFPAVFYVHHRNIQIDPRRGNPRGTAVYFCTADGLQSALYVVRYDLRVPWRTETECRRGCGARRSAARFRRWRAARGIDGW